MDIWVRSDQFARHLRSIWLSRSQCAHPLLFIIFFCGLPLWLNCKEPACKTEDTAGAAGSIPGVLESLGEGNGNPLQYSCLENPMDSPWVQKSLTRLSN